MSSLSSLSSLYRALFGKRAPVDGNVIDMSEHGRVGGVSTGQGFKFVTNIDGAAPTEGNNPSITISNADMTPDSTKTITKTIGSTSYTKTLTYNAGGDLISVSAWELVE